MLKTLFITKKYATFFYQLSIIILNQRKRLEWQHPFQHYHHDKQ